MKIVIFGASGLVGGNMFTYFKNNGWEVLGTHFSYATPYTEPFNTLELNDPNNADIEAFQPDVIINCGALTWVDYCEENEMESFEKTVQSTINTLQIAQKLNAKYVYIGTDYIFDGKSGPYTEKEIPSPVNVYGSHKLQAENLVLQQGIKPLSLRITNVYGDELRNKNFVARLLDLATTNQEQELKLPVDQFATPVNALDIAKAAYALIADQKEGVYNIASTDYVNRMQLAQMVLKHCKSNSLKLVPLKTKDIQQSAERPLYGGLISAKFLSEYPSFEFSTVQNYVQECLNHTV